MTFQNTVHHTEVNKIEFIHFNYLLVEKHSCLHLHVLFDSECCQQWVQCFTDILLVQSKIIAVRKAHKSFCLIFLSFQREKMSESMKYNREKHIILFPTKFRGSQMFPFGCNFSRLIVLKNQNAKWVAFYYQQRWQQNIVILEKWLCDYLLSLQIFNLKEKGSCNLWRFTVTELNRNGIMCSITPQKPDFLSSRPSTSSTKALWSWNFRSGSQRNLNNPEFVIKHGCPPYQRWVKAVDYAVCLPVGLFSVSLKTRIDSNDYM